MSIKNIILTLFITALIPRLFVALSTVEKPSSDALGYDVRAISILQDRLFGENQKPSSFKPPLYSFFLALIYFLFGHSYVAARIIQAILGVITCILVFFIALRLAGSGVALASGLLSALNISFIKNVGILSSELLSTFFISLIVLSLIKLDQRSTLGSGIWIGTLVGLATLNRTEMAFFLPFIYLGWLILVYVKRYPLRVVVKNIIFTFMVFFLIISFWSVRNWRIHRTFVPLTTATGINLYSSYRPPEGKLFGLTADDEVVRLSRKIGNEAEESKFLAKETFKFIRTNISKLPRLELLKFLFFWSIFDWEIIGNGIFNISYGIMLPFFILAFVVTIKKWRQYYLLFMPILYFQCMALIFYGSPRFRIPCEPFIIIFASMGILYFFNKFASRIIPSAIFSAFVSMNVAGYFYSPTLKEFAKCILVKTGVW